MSLGILFASVRIAATVFLSPSNAAFLRSVVTPGGMGGGGVSGVMEVADTDNRHPARSATDNVLLWHNMMKPNKPKPKCHNAPS